ncbi:MAG TPA: DUF1573 domain-containing protein [Cyclobacteriaceae bacterium]|jgi:hypothetical protein
MKKLMMTMFFLLTATIGFSQTAEQKKEQEQKETQEKAPGPVIAFEIESHDFGDIEQGDIVEWTFKFENKGDEPLILSNVAVTCGCTATSWPREPVGVGEKGELTVKFNSVGKSGAQNKVITIYSNARIPISRVSIVTNVLPKKKVN